jgi:hypothetical protein
MHFDALFLQFSHGVFRRSAKARASIDPQPRWIAGSSQAMTLCESTIRDAALQLTRCQRDGVFCIDPEPARAVFINSKPHCEVRRRGSEPVK